MLLVKFNLIFLLLISTSYASKSKFLKECINFDFKTKVSHSSLPFGLMKKELIVDKKKCEVSIMLNRFFVWKKKWLVDVCRQPVHIKEGIAGVDVIKKTTPCYDSQLKKNEFCSMKSNLELFILDEGLIFAKGEKEDLDSDHGKVYCAFSLIKDYLNEGTIFSRYFEADENNKKVESILKEENKKVEVKSESKIKDPPQSINTTEREIKLQGGGPKL